jgi:hypothetical protein
MKWKLFFLIFPFLLTLVSCGTVSVASTSPLPTKLQVERVTHTINYFSPFSRTITKAQSVQVLYNAALALPEPLTTGARSCSGGYGLTYHLHFSQNGMSAQQMDLKPSGCGDVLIIGKNDTRAVSKAFITSFAQTMGVSLSQIIVNPLPLKRKPTL